MRNWRSLAVGLFVVIFTVASFPAALAGPDDFWEGGGIEDGGATDDVIWSEVVVEVGSGGGGESVPLESANVSWEPPVCWKQPLYTPEEFADLMADETGHSESAQSDWLAEIRDADYHRGDDGYWWGLVYNQHLPEEQARGECGLLGRTPVWVEEGELPDDDEVGISPEILAQVAYAATELPAPAVQLRPPPEAQKVNLDVHAALDGGTLPERVTTTASIDYLGVEFAATTVARPTELRVEAGTEHAEPATCTYQLFAGELDTADADCNITYLKASGEGTYPLTAELTWEVHWTASADPDGPAEEPALDDGRSIAELPVTVEEVQAIVR